MMLSELLSDPVHTSTLTLHLLTLPLSRPHSGTVAARDQSMADRETDISTLHRQSQSIVEKLKV